MMFHNTIWFIVNTATLLCLFFWIHWGQEPLVNLAIYSTYSFASQPVVKYVNYIIPSILGCGVISLILVWIQNIDDNDDVSYQEDVKVTEAEIPKSKFSQFKKVVDMTASSFGDNMVVDV
jgi:hypothetical protein